MKQPKSLEDAAKCGGGLAPEGRSEGQEHRLPQYMALHDDGSLGRLVLQQ